MVVAAMIPVLGDPYIKHKFNFRKTKIFHSLELKNIIEIISHTVKTLHLHTLNTTIWKKKPKLYV